MKKRLIGYAAALLAVSMLAGAARRQQARALRLTRVPRQVHPSQVHPSQVHPRQTLPRQAHPRQMPPKVQAQRALPSPFGIPWAE